MGQGFGKEGGKGGKWEDLRGIGKGKGEIEEVGMGWTGKGRRRSRGEKRTLQTTPYSETAGFASENVASFHQTIPCTRMS
jgi:hypothetical protein